MIWRAFVDLAVYCLPVSLAILLTGLIINKPRMWTFGGVLLVWNVAAFVIAAMLVSK